MDTLSKSDFPEIISGKFSEARVLTPEELKTKIVENFEKGKITEEVFIGTMSVFDRLEKGKRANVGETRTWGGKKYQKGANGWTPVKEGGAESESKKFDNSSDMVYYLESKMGRGYQNLVEQIKEEGFDGKVVESALDDFHTTGKFKKEQLISHFKTLVGGSEIKETPVTETKVSDFGIAGKVGGGFRATGTINGKKMGVDIPVEMVRGVANFDGKELRQKIKAHLAEKGEEITTGKKDGQSEEIGKTNSGKSIYETAKDYRHKNFTPSDHSDAHSITWNLFQKDQAEWKSRKESGEDITKDPEYSSIYGSSKKGASLRAAAAEHLYYAGHSRADKKQFTVNKPEEKKD